MAENRMGVDDKLNVSKKCDGVEEWQQCVWMGWHQHHIFSMRSNICLWSLAGCAGGEADVIAGIKGKCREIGESRELQKNDRLKKCDL